MAAEPFTLKWGILSCGAISESFTKDIALPRAMRTATDVKHVVVAAATRNSAPRAEQFLKDVGAPATARGYGSYRALVADADVEAVYVGTPHSHHYQHARLALEAGKHVLCEKAFTTCAAQAEELVKIAREKGLFLMEAVWTRYFPDFRMLSDRVRNGDIGDVARVTADLSFYHDIDGGGLSTNHRLLNQNLAGGALLDLGIYSLTWVFEFLYHITPAARTAPPKVAAGMTLFPPTGVDESTSIVLTFPTGAHGIATTGFRLSTDPDHTNTEPPSARICGSKGELQILGPCYKPTGWRIVPQADNPASSAVKPEQGEIVIEERGMWWEADEVARCLRDGKKESEHLPLEESIVMMRVMDEARRQGGLVYPERIESLEYPIEELF